MFSTANVAGLRTGLGLHGYSAAKAEVIHLTRSVAMEIGDSGVRVNCICPGGIATPIFGKGVVFDASPERRKEMLHNSALRGEQMKGHAATIEAQVKGMIADWGDEGEIELLDFFSELTIYTSTACLIGVKFRNQLDHRFAEYYHELERGTDPLCYVDPYLPIESFQRRDEARIKLVALVQEIMNQRLANPPKDKADRDMLDVLVSPRVVSAWTGGP